jgi:hypothetical protein
MNEPATCGIPLHTQLVRELDVVPEAHPHGRAWIGAASSLVCVGRHAYVVADDEHHLAHFSLDNDAPVELLQLFDGHLPRDKGKRKKAKPDLESLAVLPPLDMYPHGALLALGSGSRPSRCRGKLLALDATGAIHGPALAIDLSMLYAPLQLQFSDLNIEGAFISEGKLHLLQRGNKSGPSGRISFDWKNFAAWLLADTTQVPVATRVQRLEPGIIDGVPMAPTDAAALAEGDWLFCTVAENTVDSYSDGACLASAVCIVDNSGRIKQIEYLQGNPKVEGVALEPGCDGNSSELHLLLVTDADDPSIASQVLRITLRRSNSPGQVELPAPANLR